MPAWCAKARRAPRSAPSSTRRPRCAAWLDEAGFDADDTLLLRRTVDAQGKSRAWINGSPATVAQLREAADHLVDIHGQHAWQSLTRPAAVRALLDAQAGVDTAPLARAVAALEGGRRGARRAHAASSDDAGARARTPGLADRRGRQARAGDGEWDDAQRRAPAAGARAGADRRRARARSTRCPRPTPAPTALAGRAIDALDEVARYDARLGAVLEVLQGAQAQLQDAAHTLHGLPAATPSPTPSAWPSSTRGWRPGWRWRGATAARPAELPALLAQWQDELQRARRRHRPRRAASARCADAERAWRARGRNASAQRARAAAPQLAAAVTQAMQQLGMAGGRFEVALLPAGRAAVLRASNRSSSAWPAMPAARRGRWPRWPRAASCRAWRWPSPSPPPARRAAAAPAR